MIDICGEIIYKMNGNMCHNELVDGKKPDCNNDRGIAIEKIQKEYGKDTPFAFDSICDNSVLISGLENIDPGQVVKDIQDSDLNLKKIYLWRSDTSTECTTIHRLVKAIKIS